MHLHQELIDGGLHKLDLSHVKVAHIYPIPSGQEKIERLAELPQGTDPNFSYLHTRVQKIIH
jgi:hypothetical protein